MMGMTAVARMPLMARVISVARMLLVARVIVVARMPVVVHVIVVAFVAGMIGVFAPSGCDCFSALMTVSLIRFHNHQSIPP